MGEKQSSSVYGRSSDVSPPPSPFFSPPPLAQWKGFALPFDRHDWIIDRCGKEVRYVIDFYSGAPGPGAAVAMFIDARPALDSFEAAWDRLRMQFSWVLSGRWVKG
jgi:cytochrome c heme-lyase